MILTVIHISIHNHKTQSQVLEGIAELSRLLCRYAVFEEVYLQNPQSLPKSVSTKLKAALQALYLAMFTYLVETTLYLEQSSRSEWLTPSLQCWKTDKLPQKGPSIVSSYQMI